ncbi:MAG: hypothetical protein CMI08_15095 [Oceanospirillaceae bacterium]|nr:hypothetical protein [Thalassolituus sp.]MAS25361.1 hypothetical protein [Oceanospirillaceae bacterium]MAY00495.1 hypothetical protein [Oceanospirillaceae bacterium]MBS52655.1 hypothetical protein [Oceanospirillaceae bacterium]|tara:strand:- start:8905 stop:9132 length:228 start_codon:yes stop_codon:yes gene_type:complete
MKTASGTGAGPDKYKKIKGARMREIAAGGKVSRSNSPVRRPIARKRPLILPALLVLYRHSARSVGSLFSPDFEQE